MRRACESRVRGFTLVELVIVIVLASIVAGVAAVFIATPMQAYIDQERRAELVDAAEMALQRMARDIRRAVPNSVRVNPAGTAIEMLNAQDGGRYRAAPPGNPSTRLSFSAPDDSFNIIGPFTVLEPSVNHYLVIYNLGITGANAYDLTDVITPPGTQISIAGAADDEFHVTLDPAFQFRHESPTQRVFLVDQAVSYVCGLAGGTLHRDAGYGFGPAQPATPGVGALVTEHVGACEFIFDPAVTATRAGLVTIALTLSKDGESVRLMRQIRVQNAP